VNDKQSPKLAIEAVLRRFEGEILQKPHKYSAVKISGQRAYKAARAGKTVEIEPRKVTIYQLLTTDYQYPKLSLTARVSSGTYIRSLAEDIGEALGTGAYLSALRRTQVGEFDIDKAVWLDEVNEKLGSYIDDDGKGK
jgi:tRNA pseudouridine55 synthase